MQNDQTAARYEYKVLELRQKLIGGKLSGDQPEKVLNDHAAEGWQLKAPDQNRGRVLNPLMIWFTFERPIG